MFYKESSSSDDDDNSADQEKKMASPMDNDSSKNKTNAAASSAKKRNRHVDALVLDKDLMDSGASSAEVSSMSDIEIDSERGKSPLNAKEEEAVVADAAPLMATAQAAPPVVESAENVRVEEEEEGGRPVGRYGRSLLSPSATASADAAPAQTSTLPAPLQVKKFKTLHSSSSSSSSDEETGAQLKQNKKTLPPPRVDSSDDEDYDVKHGAVALGEENESIVTVSSFNEERVSAISRGEVGVGAALKEGDRRPPPPPPHLDEESSLAGSSGVLSAADSARLQRLKEEEEEDTSNASSGAHHDQPSADAPVSHKATAEEEEEVTGTMESRGTPAAEETEEEEEGDMYRNSGPATGSGAIEDSAIWNACVEAMELRDLAPIKRLHHKPGVDDDGVLVAPETYVKIISPFRGIGHSSKRREWGLMQHKMQFLASEMLRTQREMEKVGLTYANEKYGPTVCRGIASVHVDSSLRLVAELEVEPCCISLSDMIAFTAAALSQNEVVALLKSIVQKVGILHEAHFTHGALHGGNVLISTENGHCVLTHAAGVMSNVLFPSDFACFSPAQGATLYSVVADAWSETGVQQPGRLGISPPLDVEERLVAHTLAVTGGEAEDVLPSASLRPSDDLYAIGTLALALVLGVPVFHGASFNEVLRTTYALHTCAPQLTRDQLHDVLFGSVFHSDYAALRFSQARYSSAFIHTFEEFVLDCMSASLNVPNPSYETAAQLRQHALFRDYPVHAVLNEGGVAGDVYSEEQLQNMQDVVHRAAYPVYTNMEYTRSHCGTKPYITRFHRNSIFAARWNALFNMTIGTSSLSARQMRPNGPRMDERRSSMASFRPVEEIDVTAALWPYLGRCTETWHVSVPSVSNCSSLVVAQSPFASPVATALAARHAAPLVEAVENEHPALYGSELYFPSRTFAQSDDDNKDEKSRNSPDDDVSSPLTHANKALYEQIQATNDCVLLPHLHAVLFTGKTNAMLTLSRDDVQKLNFPTPAFDTLILSDLTDCHIEVLCYFRYIIISNVANSEILTGPSFACALRQVSRCNPVAIATSYLLLNEVDQVSLSFSGSAHPHAFDDTVSDVTIEPYSVTYPGLSEDYARAGLAQEHKNALVLFAGEEEEEEEEDDEEEQEDDIEKGDKGARRRQSVEPAQRSIKLLDIGRQGHDIPYSHALAAAGNRFVHCDDGESDVYFYFNELKGKDVTFSNIHGGGGSAAATAAASANGRKSSTAKSPFPVRLSSQPTSSAIFCELQKQTKRRDGSADNSMNLGGDHKMHSLTSHSQARYPVLFLLDVIGDVVITNCSQCTIFVLGCTGSLILEQSHDLVLYCLAKELVIDGCADVKVAAFATEYFEVVKSRHVVVDPLYVQCPYFDEVLDAVMANASSETEAAETGFAYSQYDIDGLNIILRAEGREVGVTDSTDVVLHDAAWFAAHPNVLPVMLSVPVPAVESVSEDIDGDVSALTACHFFEQCCRRKGEQIEVAFDHRAFADCLYVPVVENPMLERPEPECNLPLVRLHDLVNTSILRITDSMHLRNGITQEPHHGMNGISGDLVLERIAMGALHFAEAVGNLYIRHCSGPLDIVVCAAQNVVLEGCDNVVVRTACFTFAAQDCHHCHASLHVNTQPRYLRCSNMMTSALNVTTANYEELLEGVGVQVNLNLYNRPLILQPHLAHVLCAQEHVATSATSLAVNANGGCGAALSSSSLPLDHGDSSSRNSPSGGQSGDLHRYCAELSGTDPFLDIKPGDDVKVESVTQAFCLLRHPVTVVPPLGGLCVGLEKAAFLERFEARVNRDIDRPELQDVLNAALCYFTTLTNLEGLHAEISQLVKEKENAARRLAPLLSPPIAEDIAVLQIARSDRADITADGEVKQSFSTSLCRQSPVVEAPVDIVEMLGVESEPEHPVGEEPTVKKESPTRRGSTLSPSSAGPLVGSTADANSDSHNASKGASPSAKVVSQREAEGAPEEAENVVRYPITFSDEEDGGDGDGDGDGDNINNDASDISADRRNRDGRPAAGRLGTVSPVYQGRGLVESVVRNSHSSLPPQSAPRQMIIDESLDCSPGTAAHFIAAPIDGPLSGGSPLPTAQQNTEEGAPLQPRVQPPEEQNVPYKFLYLEAPSSPPSPQAGQQPQKEQPSQQPEQQDTQEEEEQQEEARSRSRRSSPVRSQDGERSLDATLQALAKARAAFAERRGNEQSVMDRVQAALRKVEGVKWISL